MLWECKKVQAELRRLVGRTTNDSETRKDLIQDAMVHLWREETQRPGRSRSWYLQGCLGHIRNRLRCGRSLDNGRRANRRVTNEQEPCSESEETEEMSGEQSGLGMIYARDILCSIWPHLGDTDRTILLGRMVGLTVREIAREVGLSHPAVCSRWLHIASVARGLGISP
jgi:RNA polymerase sigma factor (sigma-70 family)